MSGKVVVWARRGRGAQWLVGPKSRAVAASVDAALAPRLSGVAHRSSGAETEGRLGVAFLCEAPILPDKNGRSGGGSRRLGAAARLRGGIDLHPRSATPLCPRPCDQPPSHARLNAAHAGSQPEAISRERGVEPEILVSGPHQLVNLDDVAHLPGAVEELLFGRIEPHVDEEALAGIGLNPVLGAGRFGGGSGQLASRRCSSFGSCRHLDQRLDENEWIEDGDTRKTVTTSIKYPLKIPTRQIKRV